MEKLSIVMATINDSIATAMTIAQILHQLENDGIDYEIILVNNGSDEQEKINLQSFLDFHKDFPIQYFEYDIKGTIPPHSFGVTKAIGKYISMPDPHLVFSPHYFKVMLETLTELKDKGVEVLFSPFSVGCITRKDGDVISGSHFVNPNPFGKVNSIGESCKMTAQPHPVLANSMAGFVCEREWFLKIGNMFPEAFKIAGGHTAESLMIGIPTWMFGKKCYVQPSVIVEHPVYRRSYGAERNANMPLSMATGAYILGGSKFLEDMPHQYGKFVDGDLEAIPQIAKEAREYVEKNIKITLDELLEKWEEIKHA